ncbi:MAG: transglutaminase domain-containing protein [Spirochaetales bacterium]|nr:transglutaminase domain-containing protein [Spirochaetales bacterium]
MKRIKLCLAAWLFVLCGEIAAGYTWYLWGFQEYYYTAKPSSVTEYETLSNTQKLVEMQGNVALMKNTTLYVPHKVKVVYPFNQEDLKDINPKLLASYYKDKSKQQYMEKLVAGIIGDAVTLEDAVARIGNWVRNNVTYALGSPSDPIGVIKARRAYCVGYARLTVEMLRTAGIPARELTCYIPPGCGWGFGNSGGGHAFLEYYYPGEGWYCLDPQASLQFADPYHLIGKVAFVDEVKEVDFSYAADYDEEPRAWQVYTSVYNEARENKHPAYVFKIKNVWGNYNNYYGYHDLLLKDPERFSGIKTNKGSWQMSGSGRGFEVQTSSKEMTVRTSMVSPYFSIFPGSLTSKDVQERDEIMLLKMSSSLLAVEYRFKGNAKYLFEADFTDDARVKKVMLRGEQGEVLRNRYVSVTLDEQQVNLTADEAGFLYFIMPFEKMTLTYAKETYEVDFTGTKTVRLPFKGMGKAEERSAEAAFIEEKRKQNQGGPAVFIRTYDFDGSLSPSVFKKIFIYGGSLELTELPKPEPPGFLYYRNDSFTANKDYYILFTLGNRYIKRKIRFGPEGIVNCDAGMNGNFPDSLAASVSRFGSVSFYEYVDENTAITYLTEGGIMYLDFPPESFYFTTNSKMDYLKEFRFTGGPDAFEYIGSAGGLEEFVSLQTGLFRKKEFIAGSALDSEGRRIKDALYCYNKKTLKSISVPVDANGNFLFEGIEADTGYIFYGSGGSNEIYACTVKVGKPGPYQTELSPASLNRKTLRLKKKGRYASAAAVFILFPYKKNNGYYAVNTKFTLNRKKPLSVFTDSGQYYLSLDTSIYNALLVDGKETESSPLLFDDTPAGADKFNDRLELYKSFFDPEETALMVRLSDSKGKAVSGKIITCAEGNGAAIKYKLDTDGMTVIGGLNPGASCAIKYADAGVSCTYPVTVSGPGINSVDINLSKMKKTGFVLKNYDRYFYRAYPGLDKYNQLTFTHESASVGKNMRFDCYTDEPVLYFRCGKDRVLQSFSNTGKQYTINFKSLKNNGFEIHRGLLSDYYKGKTSLLLGLKKNGKMLAAYSLRIGSGSSFKNYRANQDGLIVFPELKATGIKFIFTEPGYYTEKELDIEPDTLNELNYDVEKNADLKVILTGKKAAISGRAVKVYLDAVIETDSRVSFSEKRACYTDKNGICYLTLPKGSHVIEAVPNELEKVNISGKKQAIIKIRIK